jgi:hypothetical protein
MSNSGTNVVELETYRKAKAPLQPRQQLPWHINEALWILQETGEMEDQLLSEWELQFAASMAAWQGAEASPKQIVCLKRIIKKVEAALQRFQPPTSPDVA